MIALRPTLAGMLAAAAGAGCAAVPVDPVATAGPAERVASGFRFVEGPVWSDRLGLLLFSDIPADTVHALQPDGRVTVFRQPSGQANGLWIDAAGRLLACEHANRRISIAAPDGPAEPLVESYEGRRLHSPNDCVTSRDGHLYFTDPPYGRGDRQPELDGNHVFHRRPDGALRVVWKGGAESRPNGIALSPDGRRLYVAMTRRGDVLAFERRAGGETGAGAIFAATSGNPDGMAVDEAGNLYVATRAGIEVFAPDGSRFGVLELPEQPANCAFGGRDRRSLYVTARTSIYRFAMPVPGLAPR